MFGGLPQAGGFLDQDADLIEAIKLWRFMRHVKDLMEKDDDKSMEQITGNAAIFRMSYIIDYGLEEAEKMLASGGQSVDVSPGATTDDL